MSDPQPDAGKKDAADKLMEDARYLLRTGDTAGALSALDSVVRRLKDDPGLEFRTLVASAMFNRGVALRFARETDRALAAFDEVVSTFGRASEPVLRYWVALACFNKAFAAQDADRLQDALAYFQDFGRAFKDDTEPQIRRRVAEAMYQEGVLRHKIGEPDIAEDVFVRFLQTFGNSDEPAIQSMVLRLIGGQSGRVDLSTPAGHASKPEDAQRAADSHAKALAILTAYRETLEPFALFLRSFDLERFAAIGQGAEGPVVIRVVRRPESSLEDRLASGLRLPTIGIANPIPTIRHVADPFPKLELRNDVWRAVLLELVSSASLIVMYLSDLSPGVWTELKTISRLGQHRHTLVVLMSSYEAGYPQAILDYFKVPRRTPEPPSEIRARLPDFIVLDEQDVPFDNLRSSPILAPLFDHFEFVRALTPDRRRARKTIAELNAALVQGRKGARIDPTWIDRLSQALEHNEHAVERPLLLSARSSLAAAYVEQRRYAEALKSFEAARDLARAAENTVEEGLFLRDMADCHRASGQIDEAIACYQQAQQRLKDKAATDYIDASRKLAATYAQAAAIDSAVIQFAEAIEGARLSHPGIVMELHMELGAALLNAERYDEAQHAFREALTTATQLNASEAVDVCTRALDTCARLGKNA